MEVVNQTLSKLLRIAIQSNLKSEELCLLFIEFAYNMNIHYITDHLSIEIIYDFNPLMPLDLLPLHVDETINLDGYKKKAKMMKKLHESVWQHIEKKEE